MVTKQDDAKTVIRELLTDDLGQIKTRTIYRDGLEIQITRTDDGTIRFDLPDQGKSYVLMSGRLYERQYNHGNAEPEGNQGRTRTPPRNNEPRACIFVEQLSYWGEVERVDTRIFKNRITCECGNIRWVKNSDLFQTKYCKLCTHKKRQERRKK